MPRKSKTILGIGSIHSSNKTIWEIERLFLRKLISCTSIEWKWLPREIDSTFCASQFYNDIDYLRFSTIPLIQPNCQIVFKLPCNYGSSQNTCLHFQNITWKSNQKESSDTMSSLHLFCYIFFSCNVYKYFKHMQMNFVFKGILCEKTILTTLRDVFKMVPICNFLEGKGGIDIENIISTIVFQKWFIRVSVSYGYMGQWFSKPILI